MWKRHLQKYLVQLSKQYPIITLTGPRQSGKTTLCKMAFPKKAYISLEEMDLRNYAINDPRGFLNEYNKNGVIIDEIQRAPELPTYIQGIVDKNNKPGQFILTGSQNLTLSQTVSQSLAGRSAILTLLPFSIGEITKIVTQSSINDLIFKGFYPRIHQDKLNSNQALNYYLETYIDRDIRQLKNIHNLNLFHKFLKLCAGRIAQPINLTALGNETGISHTNVEQWLSILEATYIITRLPPYYKNFNKRIVKTPKLYFYDVGLATFLLGINQPEQISRDPLKGALFENMIVMDFLKNRFNHTQANDLYFFRDSKGNEVDLIMTHQAKTTPIEIKSAATFSSSFLKGLHFFEKTSKDPTNKPTIIYGGNKNENRSVVNVISYKNIYDYFKKHIY